MQVDCAQHRVIANDFRKIPDRQRNPRKSAFGPPPRHPRPLDEIARSTGSASGRRRRSASCISIPLFLESRVCQDKVSRFGSAREGAVGEAWPSRA